MQKHERSYLRFFCRPLLFGIPIGSITIVLLLLLFSAIAVNVDLPFAVVLPLAMIAVAIGSFVGAYFAAKIAKRNGWLIGLINAFVMYLLSVLAGFAFFRAIDSEFVWIKAAVMLATGLLGGVLAVNSVVGKKRR